MQIDQEEMDKLFAEWDRVEKLIQEGKLPNTPSMWPRGPLGGHRNLHGIWQPIEERLFRCVSCMSEWLGNPIEGAQPSCPQCKIKDDVYQLNTDNFYMWHCDDCKFEWIEEDGRGCPNCGEFKP
jgi:hypothetical protein